MTDKWFWLSDVVIAPVTKFLVNRYVARTVARAHVEIVARTNFTWAEVTWAEVTWAEVRTGGEGVEAERGS